MESREDVTASIKAVRRSPTGLTKSTVATQHPLMRILNTDDPGEAVARLSAVVDRLTQVENRAHQDDARGLRAALGIGLPQLKNVTARRSEARKQGLFCGQPRTQYDAEDRAIERLVDLLFEEATRREHGEAEVDAFQEATDQQLADPSLIAPASTEDSLDHDEAEDRAEPDHQPPAGLDAKVRAFIATLREVFGKRPLPTTEREFALLVYPFIALVAVVAVVITLGLTGTLRSWLHGRSAASTVPSTPPSAAVTNAPADKLDNTHGWGPARQTYKMASPAASPLFNSITDNPTHGDERNFLQCHDLSDGGSPWGSEVIEHPGHTYQCYLYFDNDVAPNLARMATPNVGENPLAMLHDAKVRIVLPPPNTPNVGLTGVLSASNILPPAPSEVWSSCNFVGPDRITVTYDAGSARMLTNGVPKDGVPLKGDATFTGDGALLGDNQDGYLGQNAGYILFDVTVKLG